MIRTMLSAIVAANDVVADLRSDLSVLTCLREVPCVDPNSGLVLYVTAVLPNSLNKSGVAIVKRRPYPV